MATYHEAIAEAEHDEGDVGSAEAGNILNGGDSDVCKALMERYAKSSAPQHRHLIATAVAMRSILLEEGLPLNPPAYFAAAITAFRDSDHSDSDATAALSALLSILLSLDFVVVPPPKAKDAALILVAFLKNPPPSSSLGTGTMRSLIKSLGLVSLRVDFEDWTAVESPLQMLLMFSLDRRPKVRRCAQICVEKIFRTLSVLSVVKKASKIALDMFRKCVPLEKNLNNTELSIVAQTKELQSENVEILHMLNVLKVIVPNLSKKVKNSILSDAIMLLDCHFSWLTGHALKLLGALVSYSEVEVLVSESENIISLLTSYVSFADKNPIDTVIAALALLKNCLHKLHEAQPCLWTRYLPLIFASVAGYLNSDANTSKEAEMILRELIDIHIDQSLISINTSAPCDFSGETTAIASICTVFEKMLDTCEIPAEHALTVISVLFFKLGKLSYFFMKGVLLKLSQKAMVLKEELPNMKHLEACIGTAVTAMGPENVLSLIPVSLNVDNITCSNTWIIPILRKYVIAASLQYFMEHIVPLAKSVQNACKKVKNTTVLKGLQTCFHDLWDLLPAFCCFPTDTSKKFEDLSKLLTDVLRNDASLHVTIAKALQVLVNGNKCIIRTNRDTNHCGGGFIFNDLNMDARSSLAHYSKKTAARNIKAFARSSLDLLQTLTVIFLDSTSEKHAYMKDAIGCLASVIGSENMKYFFVSLLDKCELVDGVTESSKADIQEDNGKEGDAKTIQREAHEKRRCLVMELASCFVEGADKDLINIMFDFVRSSLLATGRPYQSEAYYTLSKILEEHSSFCFARIDDLMDLLFSIKLPTDSMILKNRLSCFRYLLVNLLEGNDMDMDAKAFLILNEIIVTLKTKKESRKLAYDILLTISHSLKNSQSASEESNLQRLLIMVMGYLSSSSSHIVSGAISALSLLVYNDAAFCLAVPNLIPSVLTLLQSKAIEVIKAALGFIKVLVSSLHSDNLRNLLSDIVNGILPWSSVSKHHFRLKVGMILEILIRKCGCDAVDMIVPEKYKAFVKTIEKGRQSKKTPKGLSNPDREIEAASSVKNGARKRAPEEVPRRSMKHPKNISDDDTQKGKKRRREEGISDGNKLSHTSVKAQRRKSTNPEILSKTQLRSTYKTRRMNVDEGKTGSSKQNDFERRTNVNKKKPNQVSVASVSSKVLKSNKNRRSRNHYPKS